SNIKTFIFFDIETTGLPYEEYNRTRITEMCFVAVQSDHISLGVYPRIQNKLVLCFNPQKMISPRATELTKLANDLLEFQPTFSKDTCEVISRFLALQRGPLCFVAHNGNYFDYPILNAEVDKLGWNLFDEILCIDSLQLFRDMDCVTMSEETIENNKSSSQLMVHDLPTQKDMPVELCDGYDELLCDALDDIEHISNTNKAQVDNENTPKKLNTASLYMKVVKISPQDNLYFSPPASKIIKNSSTASTSSEVISSPGRTKQPRARKQLDFGRRSYKLIDVYKRLTSKVNANSHLADQDVNMLIECAATLGQDFVDWANANAKKLSDIPKMKPGVKLGE
ncbi:hypothetical protein AMK59_554, partial [Oryctes borbonicus]